MSREIEFQSGFFICKGLTRNAPNNMGIFLLIRSGQNRYIIPSPAECSAQEFQKYLKNAFFFEINIHL